jgi:hypothetical protein
MAEIAQEWRDLAREIEAEASEVRDAGAGEPPSRNVSTARMGRVGGRRRWPAELAVGLVIGALGALTLAAPRWVEASTGLDIDRGSGVLEWAVTVIVPLAGIAALAMRARSRGRLAKNGR